MEGRLTGLIKFAAFSAVLIALLVFVVIPVVAGPIISGLARDAGVQGDDLDVSVDLFGPSIFTGRAPSVRVQADDVMVPRAVIGRVDVTLTDVSPSDRSFASISGTLHEVRVSGPGGLEMVVQSIDLEGPAEATRATGSMDRTASEELVREIAGQAGVAVDAVTLRDGSLTIERDGQATQAQLRVAGDALILQPAGTDPVVLLAPAPSESWRLSDVRITPHGMMVDVTVDARQLVSQMSGSLP
ncbi:MAG: hypothetical protein WKF46_01035 [Candidatus Limnocylindrales bacterium]|jgi:hypothetical protein